MFSQENNSEETTLFAQCHFTISDRESLELLQQDLKMSPFIQMARLDWHTQRALILTTGIVQLTEEDFKSWFGEYAESVRCIQIGVYGIDSINPYPFQNCQD